MAKFVSDSVLDAALDYIKDNTTKMFVCTAQPTTVSNARSYSLASHAMTSADFTLANGDSSGRKVTCAQQADISIGYSGTATHVALTSASAVILVTTCTSQVLTSGGTVTVPAFDDEIADPS